MGRSIVMLSGNRLTISEDGFVACGPHGYDQIASCQGTDVYSGGVRRWLSIQITSTIERFVVKKQ